MVWYSVELENLTAATVNLINGAQCSDTDERVNVIVNECILITMKGFFVSNLCSNVHRRFLYHLDLQILTRVPPSEPIALLNFTTVPCRIERVVVPFDLSS
jgi:hypothetical protein